MAVVTTRLLITDDDPLVRGGLSLMLGGSSELAIVGEARDGREAVDRVRRGGVDVVLMDLRMPVMDGIEATAQIRALPDPPAVIVLTTFDADDYVLRALAAGANGFLLKDTGPASIIEAITKVVAGEPILSPVITRSLIRQVAGTADDPRETAAKRLATTLSERELEVAVAVGRGGSNAEIAGELFMSQATVKAHISKIFTKLSVTNRVQVAITMHDAGLL